MVSSAIPFAQLSQSDGDAPGAIVSGSLGVPSGRPHLDDHYLLEMALQTGRSMRAGEPMTKIQAQALLAEIRKMKAAAENGSLRAGTWHVVAPKVATFIDWLSNGIRH